MSLTLRYTLLGTKKYNMKKTVFALKELKDLNEKHNLMINKRMLLKRRRKRKGRGRKEEEEEGKGETLDARVLNTW